MASNWASRLALPVGFCVGLAASLALGARNSSGTYSLPTGNPVVSGTAISSSTHNTTMSDVATELTDSLSRSGKGPMTAPLRLANGTVALPALSFDSDTDCGLYRIGANNVGLALNGAKVLDVATAGLSVTGTLTSTALATFPVGVTVTQSASNTDAITTTGNGTGDGIQATSSGAGAGGRFSSTSGNAVDVGTGNLKISASDPSSSTGFSGTLTSMNIPKAWAVLNGNGGSAATILSGFNVTNIQESGSNITVDFTTDFGSANCACVVNINDNSINAAVGCAAATATISGYNIPGAATASMPGTSANISIVCFGAN